MTHKFVAYSPEYHDQIIHLQKYLWSTDPITNAQYLDWKYTQNPYIREPIICLALQDGQVVGMRGAWGGRWKLGSTLDPVIIPCAGDTVISPAYRKSGLLRELNGQLLAMLRELGFPFVFNLSAGERVFHGSLKDGWHVGLVYGELSRTPVVMRTPGARKLRDKFLRLASPALRRAADKSVNLIMGRKRPNGVELAERPREDLMAALVSRTGVTNAVCHVRDAEYFSWRYRSPISNYRFLFSGSAALDGYMVLQTKSDRAHEVNIVDWEVGLESIFEKLILSAICFAGARDLLIWSQSLPAPFRPVLEKLGFEIPPYKQDMSYERGLLFKETNGVEPSGKARIRSDIFTMEGSWCPRMIYSDDY